MVRREQISEQCSDDMPTNSIILAVQKSFGKVLTDFDPEPTLFSAAVVWPESTPNSPNMRTCLQEKEAPTVWWYAGLFPGAICFPPGSRGADASCVEVVQMLTGPKRGFDARVVDHYGPCAEDVRKLHPALSLGLSSRKADHCFHGWQVQVFLEQLRDAASNALRLPRFKLKERKPKGAPNKATTSATANDNHDDDEPAAKKRKLLKRPEVMYLRDSKPKRADHTPYVKQRGLGRGQGRR
ncbi:unnamed protein product [Heligmosomoides polygyrus]|uniref:Tudor domain-containing protein n=1 Tax=Heligmosomoides polygyrus TaxID=6339 RepID=A0A183FIL2_HELPZ|nr:unnamed protein product [Heligmosomoides polygyrus]